MLKDAIVGFVYRLFDSYCGMLFLGIDLAMDIPSKFVKGLVAIGTTEHIRLP